jgi:hypothetical protein
MHIFPYACFVIYMYVGVVCFYTLTLNKICIRCMWVKHNVIISLIIIWVNIINNICVGIFKRFCLYLYCRSRSSYQKGGGECLDLFIQFNLARTNLISSAICREFLCSKIWGERWLFVLLMWVELLTITV